ncbi:unnamed protein product, partial [Rotaria socialis]
SDDDRSEGNDGDDDNDDDNDADDDEDHDDESDENIARRLGFLPIDSETIHIIGRLRNLTNKQSFDRRDFETLQSLTDELIQLQHLENSSKYQLKQIVRYLKLYRPLSTKSHALVFIQERIPRRAVKYNVIAATHENGHNVFNIWRERERRARLDSKDSLEDDIQIASGQQLRDVTEINHPTPPILLLSMQSSSSSLTSKVKQMARNIDTRSTSTRAEININAGDRFSDHAYTARSSSPTYPGIVSVALYDIKSTNKNDGSYNESSNEDRLRNKPTSNPASSLSPTPSEPSRVRQMIDRLESSSSSSINTKAEKKASIKKSLHDENSDGSTYFTSSPPYKRFAPRNYHERNILNGHSNTNGENFGFTQSDSNDEVFFQNNKSTSEKPKETKFELKREEIKNESRRKISGTTVSHFAFACFVEILI